LDFSKPEIRRWALSGQGAFGGNIQVFNIFKDFCYAFDTNSVDHLV